MFDKYRQKLGSLLNKVIQEKHADMFESIDLENFWDEGSDKCEPLTNELIRFTQAELGYKLPDSYIYLMKNRNGGKPKNHCFVTKDFNTVYISHILGMSLTDPYALSGKFGSRFMIKEWGYPDTGVVICHSATRGHEAVFLDYSECGRNGEPKVVYIEQEANYRTTLLADSFEEFIKGLGCIDVEVLDTANTWFLKKCAEVYDGKLVVCKKGYEIDQCPKEVVIPDGVTVIDKEAFYKDKNIVKVVCPESVEVIGDRAFFLCEKLEEVILPKTVKDRFKEIFSECTSLKCIDIPHGVTEIGEYTFSYCSALETVTIPDTVKKIENNVFMDCRSLRELYIPDSVEVINASVNIVGCDKLERVRLPENVKFITTDDCGYTMFMDCPSLKELIVGDKSYSFYPGEIETVEVEDYLSDEDIKAMLAIWCKGEKPYAVSDDAIARVKQTLAEY